MFWQPRTAAAQQRWAGAAHLHNAQDNGQQHGMLTEAPAGVVAGGHGLLLHVNGLQLRDAERDELRQVGLQVARAHLGQIPHERKRALPHVRRCVLLRSKIHFVLVAHTNKYIFCCTATNIVHPHKSGRAALVQIQQCALLRCHFPNIVHVNRGCLPHVSFCLSSHPRRLRPLAHPAQCPITTAQHMTRGLLLYKCIFIDAKCEKLGPPRLAAVEQQELEFLGPGHEQLDLGAQALCEAGDQVQRADGELPLWLYRRRQPCHTEGLVFNAQFLG